MVENSDGASPMSDRNAENPRLQAIKKESQFQLKRRVSLIKEEIN